MTLTIDQLVELRDQMRMQYSPTINYIISETDEYEGNDIEDYFYMEGYNAIYRKAYDLFIIS